MRWRFLKFFSLVDEKIKLTNFENSSRTSTNHKETNFEEGFSNGYVISKKEINRR